MLMSHFIFSRRRIQVFRLYGHHQSRMASNGPGSQDHQAISDNIPDNQAPVECVCLLLQDL
jgi:hypothetical protein